MYKIIRLVAESLIYYNRLLNNYNFNAIVEDLE